MNQYLKFKKKSDFRNFWDRIHEVLKHHQIIIFNLTNFMIFY